jgi:hypothetical protein
VEKFAKKHDNARFVMAGADNTFLLAAVTDGVKAIEKVVQAVEDTAARGH